MHLSIIIATLLLLTTAATTTTTTTTTTHRPPTRFPRRYATAEVEAVLAILEGRDVVCGAVQHDCGEINQSSSCCSTNSYCFVGTTTATSSSSASDNGFPATFIGCCAPNSPCSLNPCVSQTNRYLCPTTTRNSSGSLATLMACCPRKCPTTEFLCPGTNKCCPLGWVCSNDGQCRGPDTATATATDTETTPSETCPAGQKGCNNSAGGCCDESAKCSQRNGQIICDEVNINKPSKLSAGAKAGIAIGAIAGVSMIMTAIFFMLRRRHGQQRNGKMGLFGGGPVDEDGLRHTSNINDRRYRGPEASIGPLTEIAMQGEEIERPRGVDVGVEEQSVVEIDSAGNDERLQDVGAPGAQWQKEVPETTEFRFELYGDMPAGEMAAAAGNETENQIREEVDEKKEDGRTETWGKAETEPESGSVVGLGVTLAQPESTEPETESKAGPSAAAAPREGGCENK